MTLRSMKLNFNLSCWQNRRARIYLDSEDIRDSRHLKVNMPMSLVIDDSSNCEKIIYNNREISIFFGGMFIIIVLIVLA